MPGSPSPYNRSPTPSSFSPLQAPPWRNTVCKMKVKLRCQIFPCHHFHACATENPSSKHPCISLSLNSWCLMVFSAISRASLFEADDDTDDPVAAGQEKHYSMLHRTTLMYTARYQLKAEQGKNHTANLIYPNRNGMVWYLAVSIHTLGPVHLRRGWGCWQSKFVRAV